MEITYVFMNSWQHQKTQTEDENETYRTFQLYLCILQFLIKNQYLSGDMINSIF